MTLLRDSISNGKIWEFLASLILMTIKTLLYRSMSMRGRRKRLINSLRRWPPIALSISLFQSIAKKGRHALFKSPSTYFVVLKIRRIFLMKISAANHAALFLDKSIFKGGKGFRNTLYIGSGRVSDREAVRSDSWDIAHYRFSGNRSDFRGDSVRP